MVPNRLGDKKGTNLSNVFRFNEAMKTKSIHCFESLKKIFYYSSILNALAY